MVAFLWSGFIQSSLCFTFIQTTPAPLLGYCAGYHCVVNLYYNWVILQVCLRGSVEPMAKRSVGSSPDATRHNPRSDPEPSLLSIRKSSILRWRHPEKDWFEFRAAFLWRELPNVVKCQIVTTNVKTEPRLKRHLYLLKPLPRLILPIASFLRNNTNVSLLLLLLTTNELFNQVCAFVTLVLALFSVLIKQFAKV